MRPVRHFVIVADRARDSVSALFDCGTDGRDAIARLAKLEEQHRDDRSVDVALLGADSLATVAVTHSTYFEDFTTDLRRQISTLAKQS